MHIIWENPNPSRWPPCVPRWYPPNPAISDVPPRKTSAHVRKVLILRTFCPSCTKIVWYFGGIYRHVFRGYRWKNSIFPPLYPTPPKPYFVRPVTHSLSVHFVLPVVLPHQNSRTEAKIFTLASPPTLLHHKPPILSAKISPIFALKARI